MSGIGRTSRGRSSYTVPLMGGASSKKGVGGLCGAADGRRRATLSLGERGEPASVDQLPTSPCAVVAVRRASTALECRSPQCIDRPIVLGRGSMVLDSVKVTAQSSSGIPSFDDNAAAFDRYRFEGQRMVSQSVSLFDARYPIFLA